MRIDSTSKVIPPVTEEAPPEKASQTAPLPKDVIVSASDEQNRFEQLTAEPQAVSEGNSASAWSDVAEKVVTGVAAVVGTVVGVVTFGSGSPAAIPAAPELGLGALLTPEFGIAASSLASTGLTIAAITDFSDVSSAVSDAAGAVSDAVGDAASAVADAVSDACNW